jgi:hypothetical protein
VIGEAAHATRTKLRPRRLSEILTDIANDPSRERIAMADVRDAMGDRAYGALMFVFAAPNTLPVNAPGVSVVLGVPLLFLSLQLLVGFSVPWLPRALVQRTVPRERFAKVMQYVVPWMRRAEKLSRPRWAWLAIGPAERFLGLWCAVLSIVLILPIPFGTMGPGIAICVLAFALLERDGKAAVTGVAISLAAMILAWGVILAIVKTVSLVLRHWLGV